MKILLSTALVALYVCGINANASSGTINFSGKILKQTCTINGGVADMAITLPAVAAAALPAGATAGRTPFRVSLSQCSVAAGKAHVYFSSFDTAAIARATLASGLQNVELQLLNTNGSVIDLSLPDSAGFSQGANIQNGTAVMDYAVEYLSTGIAQPGTSAAVANYVVTYD